MKNALRVLKDTFITSLPLAAIIITVCGFVAPMQNPFDYVRLAVGYVGVVVGQAFFLIGLDTSILPIGEIMGSSLVKLKKVIFILFFGILFGFFATAAEPALAVLARQTHLILDVINETFFIWVMSAGIGIFTGFALYRVIKDINIKIVFAASYILVFLLIFFAPSEFVALSFDGSGATTGDISVPFILAMGLGVSATLSKHKGTNGDTFGIIGIASIGPILTVLIYGIILQRILGAIPPAGIYNPGASPENFFEIIFSNISDVLLALAPLLIAFLPFQFALIKLPKKQFSKILIGIIPVFIGLLIFLSSIDFGFAFAGQYIGEAFLDPTRPEWFKWLLLLIGFVLGAAITLTEPAVTVLGEQLEEMIGIKRMTTRFILAVSIGLAAMLFIIKIISQINILWFLAPLYIVALGMMKFSSKMFVGLAFDSGGVVGGALTSAMLTPLTLGIAQGVAAAAGSEAQSILINGFGIIAFNSVVPLIAIQVLGIMYAKKNGDS